MQWWFQAKLFKIIGHLQNVRGVPKLPQHTDILSLCNSFNDFFVQKITQIRDKLDNTFTQYNPSSHLYSGEKLLNFAPASTKEVSKLIRKCSNATCDHDPIPTKLVRGDLLELLIDVITDIANKSMTTGRFPDSFKAALVNPLLKKISLDPDI